jgi:hypothetical protein
MEAQETIELVAIEERLVAKYADRLGGDAVKRFLDDAVARFDDASVRTYVLLLIERRANAELRRALTTNLPCESGVK